MSRGRSIIHTLGSLRLAAVLLVMLLIAMAYATVYEQKQGLDQTRGALYDSGWFRTLLGLIALNTIFAIVARLPLERRQIGFVITHGSILVILAGALVTHFAGVRGQITLAEGESTDVFMAEQVVLLLREEGGSRSASIPMNIHATRPVEQPRLEPLSLDGITARVVRFLPDARVTRIRNDNPEPNLALEVTVDQSGQKTADWVLPGRTIMVGDRLIELQKVDGLDAVDEARADRTESVGGGRETLAVKLAGETYEIPLRENIGKIVPVADTGFQLDIKGYYPHAQVRPGGALHSASRRPVNPAADVHVINGEQTERRVIFSQHPDMGRGTTFPEVEITLTGIDASDRQADILLFALPDGGIHALSRMKGPKAVDTAITVGMPVATPWRGVSLAVTRRYDNARLADGVEPIVPPRQKPWPAAEVEVSFEGESEILPVRRFTSMRLRPGGKPYRLEYRQAEQPLGFTLILDKFNKGLYPGTMSPRSFSSRVRIQPPAGGLLGGVVSMNAPLYYGGYSMYQSSYGDDRGRVTSTFSVVHDPGMWIVFFGYGTATLGMIVVLITRIHVHRRNRLLMEA